MDELYYLCSENKGADNREADLRLCFRICRLLVFPCGGSFIILVSDLLNTVFRLAAPVAKWLRTLLFPLYHV